ncbi:uncharacterized protein LOC117344514 [Pecten maximus]|nr:uncharacterized protein LOC117344514 [Pecten maximus]
MDVLRRTVDGIVLDDVGQVQWISDLTSIPTVEYCDILIYFMKVCGWSETRLKNYKSDSGYKLYLDHHISEVCLGAIPNSGSYMYVKASCIPETRQSATPYSTWLLIKQDGHVKSGGCTCVADDGTCKHCVALLFAMSAFCERHQDRSTEVGTDVACVWDKPKKTTTPLEIEDMDIRVNKVTPKPKSASAENYNPTVRSECLSKRQVEKEIFTLCKGSNSVLLQALDPPSDDDDSLDDETFPPTLLEIAETLKGNGDDVNALASKVNSAHSGAETVNRIEEMTRGQADNPDWFAYRTGRVTASIFSSVMHFRFNENYDNYIVKKIMCPQPPAMFSRSSGPDVLKFGKDHEPIARSLYTTQYATSHKTSSVRECGLFIDAEHPFMGASPDGVVCCKCCGKGLLEVKCSYSFRDSTPQTVCDDPHYHLYSDDANIIHLKTDSPWYIQIQGQMGVCKINWCDFVFYTKKGFSVERIYFDPAVYEQIIEKSERFWNKYVARALLQ